MTMSLNESIVKDAALEWFEELNHIVSDGPHFAAGEPAEERGLLDVMVLVGRLHEATHKVRSYILLLFSLAQSVKQQELVCGMLNETSSRVSRPITQ